jgi:exodeoxyribonuclease VII small subunit
MTKKEKNITINFEQELEKLEDIINKMESGQLNLEDTLQKYEEGIKLVTNCQKQLKNAEQKVKILTEKAETITLDDFDIEDNDV